MSATAPWRPADPVYAAVMVDGKSIMFLTGFAWDHPEISYRIRADLGMADLPRAVVRRAVQNWNDAIASSRIVRLRDFRLVRARPESKVDLDIVLLSGGTHVDGSTEIVSDSEGTMVQAILRLTWPAVEAPGDLGILGSLALRGIGRALGLGNAADPSDPMYPAFNGVKLQPSGPDVAALAAIEEWYVAGSPFFYPPRGYTFV